MAYIAKKKNREGKVYLFLVESYRKDGKPRQRTLKSFGQLEKLEKEEPGILERLKKEAKEGILSKKVKNELEIKLDLDEKITTKGKNYGWKILNEIYSNLGISNVLNKPSLDKAMKLLVFDRIINPASKIKTFSDQQNLFGSWNISRDQVYRSLNKFNDLKDDLQFMIHDSITKSIGREATLVFYDVTNYYFEIDLNDDDELDDNGDVKQKGLRKKGFSKEHRPNPIVQLGLFMDSNAIPIAYKLFPGNNTDPTTYLPAIEQVKKQFGIERIVVVADKAMNSKKNISQTVKNNDGWLFSQKHRGLKNGPRDIQNFILNDGEWKVNDKGDFAHKSMIRERKLGVDQDGHEIIVKEKVLATWNKSYATREQIKREVNIEKSSKATKSQVIHKVMIESGKKYLKLVQPDEKTKGEKELDFEIKLDQELIDFEGQFDGINVLVTSELSMTDEEIISHYGELYKIEDCFRVTKTDITSRPVFVRTYEHIEAHFLTCFISLVILRLLQHFTAHSISVHKLIGALKSAEARALTQGYYAVEGNHDLQIINRALGISWEKSYVPEEDLQKYGKGWFTTFKNR